MAAPTRANGHVGGVLDAQTVCPGCVSRARSSPTNTGGNPPPSDTPRRSDREITAVDVVVSGSGRGDVIGVVSGLQGGRPLTPIVRHRSSRRPGPHRWRRIPSAGAAGAVARSSPRRCGRATGREIRDARRPGIRSPGSYPRCVQPPSRPWHRLPRQYALCRNRGAFAHVHRSRTDAANSSVRPVDGAVIGPAPRAECWRSVRSGSRAVRCRAMCACGASR